jgi:hypothetical protein
MKTRRSQMVDMALLDVMSRACNQNMNY